MTKKSGILLGAAAAAVTVAEREYWLTSREDSLDGEVVLITGGSRGLGLALAREFASQGCKVALCARDAGELEAAAADLRSRNAKVFTLPCDVTSQDDVQRLIEAVTEHFGRIDILVNNAGVIQVGPVESLQVADFEQAMRVIYWGTVYPTLAVLPGFLARRSGRLVNISSIGGKVSVPHLLPYASAKFAVGGFSQGLAAEMGSKGIAVTSIYPGLMRTGSFSKALFKGDQAREAEWFTLGATLPGASMNAGRAARQIVTAVKRRQTERTLSLPAQALATLNGLFPEMVTKLLSFAASTVLPAAHSSSEAKTGAALWDRMHPTVRLLSALGVQAMRTYNQRT